MRNKSKRPTIIVKGITQWLANSYKRAYTPYLINSEGGFYKQGNELIPACIFEKSYPLELLKNKILKGKGLDGRTNFY